MYYYKIGAKSEILYDPFIPNHKSIEFVLKWIK